MSGYRSGEYAAALVDLGRPLELPRCGGWLLERPIAGAAQCDAIGPYPLFGCRRWSELPRDLDALRGRVVAVALVPDPFGDGPADLTAYFPDVCRPFKEHFGVDYSRDWRAAISPHHRRNVRAAALSVEVERCVDPCAAGNVVRSLPAAGVATHALRPREFLASQLRATTVRAGDHRVPRRGRRSHRGDGPLVSRRRRGVLPPGRLRCARLRAVRDVRLVRRRVGALCRVGWRWRNWAARPAGKERGAD